MIALDYLIQLNNRPRQRRDNFNRDSSFVESSTGFVIHSAVHRSTAFVSRRDHPKGWHAFSYWKAQGQAAVNAFIEATIADCDLDECEAHAFTRTRPGWTVRRVTPKQKIGGGAELVASRPSGRLVQRAAGRTWRQLHTFTKD